MWKRSFSPTCEIANREHNLRESVMHQFTCAIKLWMWWFISEVHLLMWWLTGWLPWSSNKYNPWTAPLTVCVCVVFFLFLIADSGIFSQRQFFPRDGAGSCPRSDLTKMNLFSSSEHCSWVAVVQDERGSPGRKIVLAKFCCMSHAAAIHREII